MKSLIRTAAQTRMNLPLDYSIKSRTNKRSLPARSIRTGFVALLPSALVATEQLRVLKDYSRRSGLSTRSSQFLNARHIADEIDANANRYGLEGRHRFHFITLYVLASPQVSASISSPPTAERRAKLHPVEHPKPADAEDCRAHRHPPRRRASRRRRRCPGEPPRAYCATRPRSGNADRRCRCCAALRR